MIAVKEILVCQHCGGMLIDPTCVFCGRKHDENNNLIIPSIIHQPKKYNRKPWRRKARKY